MAECTDIERKILDRLFRSDTTIQLLRMELLVPSITKAEIDRVIEAIKLCNAACNEKRLAVRAIHNKGVWGEGSEEFWDKIAIEGGDIHSYGSYTIRENYPGDDNDPK